MEKVEKLIEQTCPSCGTSFALEERLLEFRRRDGGRFWCPNGHSLFIAKSLKERRKEAAEKASELEAEVRDLKAEVTRLKCQLVNSKKSWLERLLTR